MIGYLTYEIVSFFRCDNDRSMFEKSPYLLGQRAEIFTNGA